LRLGAILPVAYVLLMAPLIIRTARSRRKRYEKRRQATLRQIGLAPDDPAVQALADRWARYTLPPEPSEVVTMLGDHLPADRACIIVLAAETVPCVGERSFGPEIINPARHLWRYVDMLWVGLIFALLIVAKQLGWLPGISSALPLAAWVVLYAMAAGIGLSIACTWVYATLVRPTYIRLAPGIIQVLRFGPRGRTPRIRSYPMRAGTLVTVREQRSGIAVTLMRGGQCDDILVWRTRNPEQVMERVWWAVLSTAPTPPLSEAELLG